MHPEPPPIQSNRRGPAIWVLIAILSVVVCTCGFGGTCVFGGMPDSSLIPGPRTNNQLKGKTIARNIDVAAKCGARLLVATGSKLALLDLSGKKLSSRDLKRKVLHISTDVGGSRASVLLDTGVCVGVELPTLKEVSRRHLGAPVEYHNTFETAISPDGSWIAAFDNHGKFHVWSFASGAELFSVRAQGFRGGEVGFSPDAAMVGLSFDQQEGGVAIKVYDLATKKEIYETEGFTFNGFSEDSARVLFASSAEEQVISVPLARPANSQSRSFGRRIWGVKEHNGQLLVSMPGTSYLWTGGATMLIDKAGKITRMDHEDTIMSTIGWFDDSPLAAGSGDQFYIFDPATGKQLVQLVGGQGRIDDFWQLGSSIVSHDDTGGITIWRQPL